MKTFKVNYLAPNAPEKQRSGRHPIYVHKVTTYHCNTEEEAVEKFNKYHGHKRHQLQFVWEETDIDRLRAKLTKMLMPRR